MIKYYTRACNFYYGEVSKKLIKKKLSIPLNNNKNISFDTLEIISRKSSKKVKLNELGKLNNKLKKKILKDLKNIKKKKIFKNLKFKNRPLIMGVVNVTPDSFSDGGKFFKLSKAIAHIKHLIKLDCDLIDIGAESTRPGAKPVIAQSEWKRLKNIFYGIKKFNNFFSLDTRNQYVMKKALNYNIGLINDVSGLSHDAKTLEFLKKTNVPFVINHSQGNPQNMQKNPKYNNVLLDIYDFFEKKINEIRSFGINHKNIILDPGIGFGKNLKHNITLLRNVSIFHTLGYPLLLGVSRKKFIKDISGVNDSKERLGGTISTCLILMMNDVQILRVHDVNELKQSIKIFKKLIY